MEPGRGAAPTALPACITDRRQQSGTPDGQWSALGNSGQRRAVRERVVVMAASSARQSSPAAWGTGNPPWWVWLCVLALIVYSRRS